MATATRTTTDARARSIELAQAHGETICSHRARTLGWTLDERGQLVSLALEIRSAHDGEQTYSVGYLASRDDGLCDCQAAQHHSGCWHRGLAILCGRHIAQRARRGWQED